MVPGVTIEKYVRKTETVTTTDGTDYIKSGVCEHIEDEAYMSAPELLAGKVSYQSRRSGRQLCMQQKHWG